MSKLLQCEKKKKNDSRISSSIQDLRQENWLVKQLVKILEHFRRYNLEILFFIMLYDLKTIVYF